MSGVRVNIDRIVLNGVPAEQQKALVESLRIELVRAFSEATVPRNLIRSQSIAELKLGRMVTAPGHSGVRTLAGKIARRITGGRKS